MFNVTDLYAFSTEVWMNKRTYRNAVPCLFLTHTQGDK